MIDPEPELSSQQESFAANDYYHIEDSMFTPSAQSARLPVVDLVGLYRRPRQRTTTAFDKPVSYPADDVGHLPTWPCHAFSSVGGCFDAPQLPIRETA